jgi:H+/Cl- antiporter ClcA
MRKIKIEAWIKEITGKISNSRVRQNVLQALPFWVASILTGLVAVLYAKLFSCAEVLSHYIIHLHPWLLFILTPSCFVAAWWVVNKFEKNAAGSGIPQVMAAVELSNPRYNYLVDKLLSVRIVVVKITSTLFMILGGGVIGREGPTIQIAGSIFRKINLLLPDSWPKISKKNMIITGAAAGLAAAFNTPLGGIVFAVEELAKTHISYFKTALFTAVIIAGLTAQGILGSYLYLGYPDVGNLTGYLTLCVLLVACISGLTGSYMSVIILKILNWKRTIKDKR